VYTHLVTHSCYSLLEALPSPQDLVTAAADRGMKALALTDHRYLTGAVEFYQACQKAGIQPILGLEIDLAWDAASSRVLLLAESLDGWSNLCRISSAGFSQQDPEAPLPVDLLARHSSGLIALSGDLGDPFGMRLRQLKDLFPDRLYLLLRDDRERARINELALKLELPTVAAHPVYTLSTSQSPLLKTLAAIRLNTPLSRLPPGSSAPESACFLGTLEMQGRFKEFPAVPSSCPWGKPISHKCPFLRG
jgi:DNA polymerase-3 subunit alpha